MRSWFTWHAVQISFFFLSWPLSAHPLLSTTNFGVSMKRFLMIFQLYDDISTFENVRKTPPTKRLTKNQKIRGPSNLTNPIVLPKILTVFFSIHNPPFSALRGFHAFRNESPSRVTRSLNLVMKRFYNLHRCRRFGWLILTDWSVSHGQYLRSSRLHIRENTVDINSLFDYT